MLFLTEDQVTALAHNIQHPPALQRGVSHRDGGYPDYALLVRFAAFTGLRAGEIGALRVSRLNLLRRRVKVSESVDEANGRFNIGPTKTYSRRSVGLPGPLVDELAVHLSGMKQTDLVFAGPEGGPLRHSNWYPRHFKPAVVRRDARPVHDFMIMAPTATSSQASTTRSTTPSAHDGPGRPP
ncbi:MAG: tyrosine-type recombinase/integrase [Actinobacteria bacterium]|nr:tyrosine-type recombinase/integrase [Actinomycetota bacterium]